MPSIPQTYTISDFVQWDAQQQLELAPSFQRGAVWTPPAQMFLIDTILKQLPIPQIYLRTRVNPTTKSTVREVVDGQQRLRAILAFAKGDLRLGSRFGDLAGRRYQDLSPELQEGFLSYQVTTVQLMNASDADVLEVFARLNSYSVKVTPAELRHAKYNEPIKWGIWRVTQDWPILWDHYKVVSLRDSVRLRNTSIIAEIFMTCLDGFGDGGEDKINKFYANKKALSEEDVEPVTDQVNELIAYVIENFGSDLDETTFFDAPNFLILVAACAFLRGEMNNSSVTIDVQRKSGAGIDTQRGIRGLLRLAAAVENDDTDGPLGKFVSATKSTTQRVSSRKVRFEHVVSALAA